MIDLAKVADLVSVDINVCTYTNFMATFAYKETFIQCI